jgi:drug/metabolite transporter (DMT)-like permease
MMLSKEPIALAAICALAALGSLAGVLFVLIRGEIAEQGLDGLFLLAICATFAAAFGLVMAQTLRKGRLKDLLGAGKSKTSDAVKDRNEDASVKAGNEGELAQQSPKTAGRA